MRLNFARQPLIPAFLSLVLLLVVALCHTASGTIAPILRVGVDQALLPIPAPGAALEAFRLAHPSWAHTIGGFLILFSAMTIGRMTARFKLYGINTFVAMPLYALCMMGVVRSEWWFSGLVASTLLTLAVKNFCYSFRNGFSFDDTFRGGMYENIDKVEIRDEDIEVTAHRSSGAGGQHINKTDSAIRILHKPTGIVVGCQTERSQLQNKETAMKMLKAKLMEIKLRERLDTIEDIQGNKTNIEWGSQIRSYVFMPYTLAKDTRTGYEDGNITAVMDGEIDGFINAYLKMNAQ